jgi:hypothetical protein
MAGSDEKRGIAATNDRIFVGGMDRYIYVLDFEGSLLSTIFVNGEKFCYLLTTNKGDLVYSDFSSIHRIKLDGTEVLLRFFFLFFSEKCKCLKPIKNN